jgi:hypothetical protein
MKLMTGLILSILIFSGVAAIAVYLAVST